MPTLGTTLFATNSAADDIGRLTSACPAAFSVPKTIDAVGEGIGNFRKDPVKGLRMGDFVSADLYSPESSQYRGCIDGFEPESGLLGWAIDLKAPAENLSLRFLVGGMALCEVKTSYARPDISAEISAPDIQPGFCIPTVELRRLAKLVALRPAAEFSVQIGTTSRVLPRIETLPTLCAAVEAVLAQSMSDRSEFDLVAELARMVQVGESLASFPLRPFDEARTGFIEALCTEDQVDGLTWIVGWVSEADLRDPLIVLVDGQKFSGAIALCKYARADLPVGGIGFIGLIYSNWRARPTSTPILYYGNPPRHHLMSLPDLPRLSKQDILRYVERHRATGDRASWADFYKILTGADSWLTGSSNHAGVQCGIDRLILVPRFGCFVAGWVLSYSRAIDGFALKVGSAALSMDRASLSIRARPDLIEAFPGCVGLIERAGFVCLFPGHPDLATSEKPLLKVLVEGGGSSIFPIGPTHVRRLGYSESLDSLLQLYANLESESFFPSLVVALQQEYLNRCVAFDVESLNMSKKALVVSIPPIRDDYFFVLEDLRYNAPRHLDKDTGIIFLVDQRSRHGELEALVRDIRAELTIPCSLVFVPEIAAALYVLGDVLVLAGSSRFCFVAVHEVLTQDGWQAVAKFLVSSHSQSVVFESVDPETFLSLQHHGGSFGCNWSELPKLESIKVKIEAQPSPLEFLHESLSCIEDIVEAGTFLTRIAVVTRAAHLVNDFSKETARAFVL